MAWCTIWRPHSVWVIAAACLLLCGLVCVTLAILSEHAVEQHPDFTVREPSKAQDARDCAWLVQFERGAELIIGPRVDMRVLVENSSGVYFMFATGQSA